jgi:hypothetical protein
MEGRAQAPRAEFLGPHTNCSSLFPLLGAEFEKKKKKKKEGVRSFVRHSFD